MKDRVKNTKISKIDKLPQGIAIGLFLRFLFHLYVNGTKIETYDKDKIPRNNNEWQYK
ncbi:MULTISPECIES: hypothetical protein [Helicobacter]|uniref:Uncharacterized protein n=1 Tax=Helicobacter bilis WiWa TaxID=1235804 RepID=N2BH73_9HELI|nr:MULTISPECIES: hypothetical protein [Helicobacter]EMZ37863.1 hypothetical protein C826_01946 [Helicobacter bilis WiWa]MDY5950183.1 hypothetical protein [Helicobacter sp.]